MSAIDEVLEKNAVFAAAYKDLDPPRPPRKGELEEQVRRSVACIRSTPFLVHTGAVRGSVYEVRTGRSREVR